MDGPGNGGPQKAACWGGGEGTHLAAAGCRGQAGNLAAAVSWLIISLLFPRLRTPWGYTHTKKKNISEFLKTKSRRKIPGWKEASTLGPAGSGLCPHFIMLTHAAGAGSAGTDALPFTTPRWEGWLFPSRRDRVGWVLASGTR